MDGSGSIGIVSIFTTTAMQHPHNMSQKLCDILSEWRGGNWHDFPKYKRIQAECKNAWESVWERAIAKGRGRAVRLSWPRLSSTKVHPDTQCCRASLLFMYSIVFVVSNINWKRTTFCNRNLRCTQHGALGDWSYRDHHHWNWLWYFQSSFPQGGLAFGIILVAYGHSLDLVQNCPILRDTPSATYLHPWQ